MLTLKVGPFHPSLERALADDLRALAREQPFGRCALVVPSRHLLDRVQEFLTLEHGLTLVGLDAFTFHGLALRLHQETIEASASGLLPSGLPGEAGMKFRPLRGKGAEIGGDANAVPLSDPAFEAYAILQVLSKVPEPEAILGRPTEFPGLARALRASVRDLREAQLDPARALEAVGEGVFEGDEEDKLVALFRLAGAYDGLLDGIGVLDPAALARAAIARAPASPYLASLRRILYYGFYDLTGQQLDFFSAVAKSFPTTCYFPFRPGHPAYAFADAFLKSHLRGLADEAQALPDAPGAGALEETAARLFAGEGQTPPAAETPPLDGDADGDGRLKPPLTGSDARPPDDAGPRRPPAVEIWNAAGTEDEVWAAAKEIVRLLDAGVPAEGIAIVARSLGPCLEEIVRCFRANAIPFWTPAGLPLLRSPAARAVELLLAVDAEDLSRPLVIEILGSPYAAREAWLPAGVEAHPGLWDLASRRCGVRRGLAEWRRLVGRRAGKPLVVIGDEEREDDASTLRVPPEQLDALLRGVEAVAGALGRIPAGGTWSEMAGAARGAVRSILRLPADASPPERAAWEAVERMWDGFREWDRLGARVDRERFLATARDALEEASLPLDAVPNAGVRVLDAMAARGHAFRVLFLIGLNEKLFPRTVREDPFLRDGARRKIAGVLGYAMAEKLAAYEEEKLLLAFLFSAARERVVCSYQRSDEEGKALVPSLYLREIRRAAFGIPFPDSARPHTLERSIPRRRLERLAGADPPGLLLPAERGLAVGLKGGDAASFAAAAGRPARLIASAVAAVGRLECHGPATPHDGRVAPAAGAAGDPPALSPTALESYARCPFQYFASRRLGLQPLEEPESAGALDVMSVGTLYHRILEAFYRPGGGSSKTPARADQGPEPAPVRARLRTIAENAFEKFERETPVGYPVVWEALQGAILANLEAFLAWDLARMREEGFRPVLLEEQGRGEMPAAEGIPPIACRGIMDRVDVADDGKALRYRIVDYKSGRPLKIGVTAAALRGERLQLPVYLILARDALRREVEAGRLPDRPLRAAASSYYYIAEAAAEGEPHMLSIDGDFWEKEGEAMGETLGRLVEGIRAGHFLIRPGQHCRSCEFAAICRKGHYPTARRSRLDPGWALYRPGKA